MRFPNPDKGPGTPYLAANLIPAMTFGINLARDLKVPLNGFTDYLEILIFFTPWIYLTSVILNAVPSWLAYRFLEKRGLANRYSATIFGILLPLFWILLFLFLRAGEQLFDTLSRDIIDILTFSGSGGLGGLIFMYLYEKRND